MAAMIDGFKLFAVLLKQSGANVSLLGWNRIRPFGVELGCFRSITLLAQELKHSGSMSAGTWSKTTNPRIESSKSILFAFSKSISC